MPLQKPKSNTFFSNTFYIFIIRFFPSLANLIVILVYSHKLLPATYGAYQNFWISLSIFYPFACFGIHVLIINYNKATLVQIVSKLKSSFYFLYALWLLILCSLFGYLQWHFLTIPFYISFLLLLSFSISIIVEAILMVYKDFLRLIVVSASFSVVYILLHIYVLYNGFSMVQIFYFVLFVTLAKLLFYSAMLKGKFNKIKKEIEAYDNFDIKKIKKLCLHLGIFDIIQMLSTYLDKFVIAFFLASGLSAIYYNGSMNIPFLPLLLSAGGSAILLQLVAEHKQDNHSNLVSLMNESGRVLSCIVFPMFFFLLFFRDELIINMFSEKYRAAIPVFLVSILVLPMRAYSYTTALQRLHRGDIINIGAISELVIGCGLLYPLYLWKGLPGVAFSFVFSTYLQGLFYLFYTSKLLKVPIFSLIPYKNWILKLIFFAALFLCFRFIGIFYLTPIITLILGSILLFLAIGFALMFEFIKHRKHGNNK